MPTTLESYDPAIEELGLRTNKPIPLLSISNSIPQNGDLWFDGTNLNVRINNSTYILAGPSQGFIDYIEQFIFMGT